jgi:hypothetical protein
MLTYMAIVLREVALYLAIQLRIKNRIYNSYCLLNCYHSIQLTLTTKDLVLMMIVIMSKIKRDRVEIVVVELQCIKGLNYHVALL